AVPRCLVPAPRDVMIRPYEKELPLQEIEARFEGKRDYPQGDPGSCGGFGEAAVLGVSDREQREIRAEMVVQCGAVGEKHVRQACAGPRRRGDKERVERRWLRSVVADDR